MTAKPKLNVSFWTCSEVAEKLREIAYVKKISISELLRKITREFIEKEGNENECKGNS